MICCALQRVIGLPSPDRGDAVIVFAPAVYQAAFDRLKYPSNSLLIARSPLAFFG
jgi:hypothetical protein